MTEEVNQVITASVRNSVCSIDQTPTVNKKNWSANENAHTFRKYAVGHFPQTSKDCPRLIKARSQYIYMYIGSEIKVESYQNLFVFNYLHLKYIFPINKGSIRQAFIH